MEPTSVSNRETVECGGRAKRDAALDKTKSKIQ